MHHHSLRIWQHSFGIGMTLGLCIWYVVLWSGIYLFLHKERLDADVFCCSIKQMLSPSVVLIEEMDVRKVEKRFWFFFSHDGLNLGIGKYYIEWWQIIKMKENITSSLFLEVNLSINNEDGLIVWFL